MSKECFDGLKIDKKPTLKLFNEEQQFSIKGFRILPFKLKHDVPCYGFLIGHSDCGNILFCTDTHSIPYNFKNIETLMIEADFDYDIMMKNIESGLINRTLADRIMRTHMSIDNAVNFAVRNKKYMFGIILLHLSKNNASGKIFQQKMESRTGVTTYIATKGLEVKLGLPF
jgi:phosphoribosyl 1,2-cyclic phosphodiesterase